MRFVLPFFALACTAESFDAPQNEDALVFLVDHPAQQFRERTRVADPVLGHLTPGGEPFTGEGYGTGITYTVADWGREIAVIWQNREVQLLVWLPRSGLEQVPTRDSWTHGDRGIRLPAGQSITVEEYSEGQTRITAANGQVSLDTWIPSTSLDHIWVEEPSEAWTPEGESYAWTRAGTELLSAPLGDALGWVEPFDSGTLGQPVQSMERARGHTRIQFIAGGWPVDAWVHDEDLLDGPSGWGFGGTGSGAYCGGISTRFATVAADSILYDSPGEKAVGRTMQDASLHILGFDGEWAEAELNTAFGSTSVWVEEKDLLPEV